MMSDFRGGKKPAFFISVSPHLKRTNPFRAQMCELINLALKALPDMTLEEYARMLHKQNQEELYKLIVAAEKKQFEQGQACADKKGGDENA